jgi:beta-galactosidase
VVPDRDHDGVPCTVLADALGVRTYPRVEATPHYFPSVVDPAGAAEVRVGHLQPLGVSGGEPLLTEVGTGRPVAALVEAGAGRALIVACDPPCHLPWWRDALALLDVRPRFTHDGGPGVVVTSTVDGAGQRLLHLLNVAPTPTALALTFRGRPLLGGRRLRLPARAGLMLPYGVRVGPATLVETTGELGAVQDGAVVLRPTQPDGDVAVFASAAPVTADRGTVRQSPDGRWVVTVEGPEPVRIAASG